MKDRIKIDSQYFNSIGRIFTPLVLDKVANNGYSDYLNEVCKNSGILESIDPSLSFAEFLDSVYSLLFRDYRNEYIYKNAIANEILLGKHSIKDSKMLTEFRVGKHRADVVILNGTSTVYEIKSQFDSFRRLNNQLDAYCQVFDHIYVVTSKIQAEKLKDSLPDVVGLLCMTDDNKIQNIKGSISNKENINPEILFDSLLKHEYLEIILQLCGSIPDVPNTEIYTECKKLYLNFPSDLLHDITFTTLKKRNDLSTLEKLLQNAPKSLFAYIIGNARKKKVVQALATRYKVGVGEVLSFI